MECRKPGTTEPQYSIALSADPSVQNVEPAFAMDLLSPLDSVETDPRLPGLMGTMKVLSQRRDGAWKMFLLNYHADNDQCAIEGSVLRSYNCRPLRPLGKCLRSWLYDMCSSGRETSS